MANDQVSPARKAAEELVSWQMDTGKFLTANNGDRAPVIPLHELERVIEAACSQTVAPPKLGECGESAESELNKADQLSRIQSEAVMITPPLSNEHSPITKLTGDKLREVALRHSKIVAGYQFCEQFDFDAIASELNSAAPPAVSTPRCPDVEAVAKVIYENAFDCHWEGIGGDTAERACWRGVAEAVVRQFFQPDSQPSPSIAPKCPRCNFPMEIIYTPPPELR